MTKASNFVSPSLQQRTLVNILTTKNILFISIYELGIAKICLAKKATLGYSIACSFHQIKGDLASFYSNSQHSDEKETIILHLYLKLEYQSDGPSEVKVQIHATSRSKKWLHFTSKGIKILLSYSTTKSLALSWPRKSMTHFSTLNFNSNIKANIL